MWKVLQHICSLYLARALKSQIKYHKYNSFDTAHGATRGGALRRGVRLSLAAVLGRVAGRVAGDAVLGVQVNLGAVHGLA